MKVNRSIIAEAVRSMPRAGSGTLPTPPAPATPPADPAQPAPTPPAAPPSTPPVDPAPPQNNQDNAWRRKFEDAEKENKALKEAEQKRKDAELSELEREKKRADDATAEAATAKAEALRLRIANEKGVPKEAVALLTGADEATLTAQADAIIALKGNAPPAPAPPVRGGTQTNPGTTPPAGIDERITAAYKSGHNTEAIRLKRVKAGLGVAET